METTKENSTPEDQITVTVYPQVKAGMEREFELAFAESVQLTRAEKGVISFDLFRINEKEGQYLLVERYASKLALEEHLAQSYTKTLFEVLHRTMVQPAEELIAFATEVFPIAENRTESFWTEGNPWPKDPHHL